MEIILTPKLAWNEEEESFVDLTQNEYCGLAVAAAFLYEEALNTYSSKNYYQVKELNDCFERMTTAKESSENERNIWCLIGNGGK